MIDERVPAEQSNLSLAWQELADRSRPTGLVYLPAALGLVCLTPELASRPPVVLGAFLYFSFITCWRFWSARELQKKAGDLDRRAKLHFDWSARLAGLSIGLLSAVVITVSSTAQLWLAILVVAALVAGAMTSFAPDFPLYVQYWLLITFPPECALAANSTTGSVALSCLIFVLTVLAVYMTWHFSRAYWRFLWNNRRQVEELNAARERLEMVILGSNLGAFDWRLGAGRIYFDQKLPKILGHSPEEFSPYEGPLEGFVHADDVARVRTVLIEGLKDKNSPLIELEARFPTTEDEVRWFLFRGRVMKKDSQGRAVRVTGTYEDITAQKKAELEVAQMKEQMEQAEKLKTLGVLAGGVAHDFNNLLLAILGNIELAQDELDVGSKAHLSLQHAIHAAQDASELSDQLLAYSGKGQFKLENFCLNKVVTDLTQLLKVTVGKRSRFELELKEELPLMKGDVGQIRQVVLNLLTNAADAVRNRGDGVISLRTGRACFDSEEATKRQLTEGNYIYLAVEDNGIGMSQETARKIFDPFFTTKFTGRGLGLASTLGIVKNHEGAVEVDSTEEVGTKFTLLFPVSEDQTPPDSVEEPAARPSRPRDILVVDDELSIRKLARRILSKAGHTVLMAGDGEEALKTLAEGRGKVDLVLLDLTMPRKDGYQTLREIRERWPELPVILSSGYSEDEVLQRAQSEVQGFLKKPFTRECLLSQVDTLP